MAFRHFKLPEYQQRVRHGIDFLRSVHRDANTGGYAWELCWNGQEKLITDATNHCYGLAFVLLAYSHACMAGVDEAHAYIAETFELMEHRFWDEQHGLYADEASGDWSTLDPYRGQNANMHACEALLAAFDATGHKPYLLRAETLAYNITVRQAALSDGLIWEHYRSDWSLDADYNKDNRNNIFRPWGFQPGHLTEWSKLLLILERHQAHLARKPNWLLARARELFDRAMAAAWDRKHGGIFYGFAPDGEICDSDKYFWVQAESLAAAALLAERCDETHYWDWYERIWDYSWSHFVDHEHGAWYRILGADNRKVCTHKSPAGKTDYHTMGACYEVIGVLGQSGVLETSHE